jgi:hypothetical protein
MFNIMEKFTEERCVSIVCFGEKEVFQNHLQMVCKIYISSFVALNKLIKKWLR